MSIAPHFASYFPGWRSAESRHQGQSKASLIRRASHVRYRPWGSGFRIIFVPYLFSSPIPRYHAGMTRNWTPRDALIEVLMEHLYVCAPGEVEARRIIERMADEML